MSLTYERHHGRAGRAALRRHGHAGRARRGRAPRGRQAPFDAVIVGGGPAGLSAALVLGRARRRVLVLDTDRPANAVSSAVGGLLGQSAVAPNELRRAGLDQLAGLPSVEVRGGEVIGAEPLAGQLEVTLGDGAELRARALVLAHGLRYQPPALPGIEPLWGRSVFHCPFCDGWEVRDRPLAVHGNGPAAASSALVVAGWSADVVLCTDGPDEHRDALFVRTHRGQPNDLAARLGCELTDAGTIVTDGDGRTRVPGVYAAGDAATERLRSVANAMGTGSRTAYAVALDLVTSVAAA